jgi:hypothetical protein
MGHALGIVGKAVPMISVLHKWLVNIIKGILSGDFGPAKPIFQRSKPLIEAPCVLDGLSSQDYRRDAEEVPLAQFFEQIARRYLSFSMELRAESLAR